LSGLVLVVALAIFYVTFGHDWYFNGHMAVCVGEEVIDQSSWCFRPPPPPDPSSDSLSPPERSLRSITPDYRGTHPYFNDDLIGRLLEPIGALLNMWGYEFLISIAPYWNAFFRSDPQRIAFGV